MDEAGFLLHLAYEDLFEGRMILTGQKLLFILDRFFRIASKSRDIIFII
jgi:hypothetical protein